MSFNTSASQQGRVVVNANLDIDELGGRKSIHFAKRPGHKRLYKDTTVEDSYLSILPGEILFMNPKNSFGKRKQIRDTHLSVFSSLNGYVTRKDKDVKDVEKDLHFVGFADIVSDYNSKKVTLEDALTQVGGIRTIRNTGTKNIKVGDWLYWSLPDPRKTQPNKKIVAEVNPLQLENTVYNPKQIFNRLRLEETGDRLPPLTRQLLDDYSSADSDEDRAIVVVHKEQNAYKINWLKVRLKS